MSNRNPSMSALTAVADVLTEAAASDIEGGLSPKQVAAAIAEHGYTRENAYAALTVGTSMGRFVRHGVPNGRKNTYTINPLWHVGTPMGTGNKRTERGRHDQGDAQAYVGPAFDHGPLMASLGVGPESQEEREGELPPCAGGRIVDALHRDFRSMFGAVE